MADDTPITNPLAELIDIVQPVFDRYADEDGDLPAQIPHVVYEEAAAALRAAGTDLSLPNALTLSRLIWAHYNAEVADGDVDEYGIEFVVGCALGDLLRSTPVTSWADVQTRIAYLEGEMLMNQDDPARIDQVKQIGVDVAQMLNA